MKSYTKTKRNPYQYMIIQDESGIDFIKVKKRLSSLLHALHAMQISVENIPVKTFA